MRLQVMYLPDETVGEVTHGRFALIVDQFDQKVVDSPGEPGGVWLLPPNATSEQLCAFGKEIGAVSVGIFADKVEVA